MSEQWEEVPGSRTVQPTQVLPGKSDEIAYRDLKPGEVIQFGDEWKQMEGGRACWQAYHHDMIGKTISEFCHGKARRPYNITELIKQRDQAAHEYRLYRDALTTEQAAHKATMANGLQACKERDEAEQALKMARASLDETRAARAVVIEERDEAERLLTQARAAQERIITERDEWRRLFGVEHAAREAVIAERNEAKKHLEEERELHAITAKERDEWQRQFAAERSAREITIDERNETERALSEERAVNVRTSIDRGRLISELNECQQQRQHLQAALEELQRRRDTAEAGYQASTLTVGEVVDNILSALEIASHALEYLADVGANEEAGHYCGFSAAIAVVKKIKESAK